MHGLAAFAASGQDYQQWGAETRDKQRTSLSPAAEHRGLFFWCVPAGKLYGVLPGDGWMQLKGETEKLPRPRKRIGKHAPKRERRVERKTRMQRVQQLLLHGPS